MDNGYTQRERGKGDSSIEIFSEDISPQLSVGRVEWICLIFKVFFGFFMSKWRRRGRRGSARKMKPRQKPSFEEREERQRLSTRLKTVW